MATLHGSVHAEISHERGMGEETMMAFIHKYLNSILQPFADSVDELNGPDLCFVSTQKTTHKH